LFEREWRNYLDLVTVLPQPGCVAPALVSESKVEADDPMLDVHARPEQFDELLRAKARERPIEAEDDRVLHASGLQQRQLLLQRGDRLRAVGRVEHAARVRLERDERGCGSGLGRGRDGAADDFGMAKVDAVEAADCDGDPTDVADGQPQVCLETPRNRRLRRDCAGTPWSQDNTFAGTNVRRSGSVWPCAINRPPASCAR